MGARDIAWLWVLAYGAALTAFAARIAFLLFGIAGDPPDDPALYQRWSRKRRWLIISEFAALPMFATLAVLGAAKGWVDPVTAVIAALISGALGFAFFLHAVEAIVRRRLSIEERG
ncbi:hypothetical protein [Sphingomonas sp. SRS2]|uniref:hypothetical protein n=1 Tax=Sphingomonas sp. SRS2 TaxID=133190 RepID=UPI0006184CDC|nr:hypothetical protein [Sphingomonas sp. SRS2]KKC24942.1 hypothetical protein WP12_17135 [Sphingomonas sp. SRS2]